MVFERLEDVTPRNIAAFRESRGMRQKFFWRSIRISEQRGNRMETGFTKISADIKLLIFLFYSDLPNPKQVFIDQAKLEQAS